MQPPFCFPKAGDINSLNLLVLFNVISLIKPSIGHDFFSPLIIVKHLFWWLLNFGNILAAVQRVLKYKSANIT